MKTFVITTDNTSDLSKEYVKEHHIGMMSLTYTVDGTTYSYDNPLPLTDLYEKMRNGSVPTTSQVNPTEAKQVFSQMLEKYDCDILHISFSSGMSGSYNSARIAAEELEDEGISHKIKIVDSLGASGGIALMIHHALKFQAEGKSIDEVYDWLEENKLHIVHTLTVDDLNHLYRGGRLSKTSAIIGSIVNVKPLIYVNDEGVLIPNGNVRGRKKALNSLVDYMGDVLGSYADKNELICLNHADCEKDAEYVAAQIRERYHMENIRISMIGPIIGTHVGPGGMILCYFGEHR